MFNVEKRNCMSNFNVKLDRARQAVNEIQDGNSKDFQEAEQLIVELKQAIRNDLMPQTEQEDKRLKDIASKLNTHIKTGFENFHTPQDISHYLESAFQRGKKDKTYGRALILIEENEMIEQVKIHFNDRAQNAKLINNILEKLIELSIEVMPTEYTEILKIEKSYFEKAFAN